jgi:hypothetical protein
MSGIDQLLTVARAYGALAGVDTSTVSSRAFNDGKKLGALERGADIQVRRMERTMQWFSDHWPPDSPWPEGIPRPETAEARAWSNAITLVITTLSTRYAAHYHCVGNATGGCNRSPPKFKADAHT